MAPIALLLFVSCRGGAGVADLVPPSRSAPTPGGAALIAAAGDIAAPRRPNLAQTATARLIRGIHPTAVLTLGDNQYRTGAYRAFRRSYDPTWGAFKNKTFPAPGNHDCYTRGCHGYIRYFGPAAHAPELYYGFDLGAWHLVSLNSRLDGSATAAELDWLTDDLANDDHVCQLAYFHHPLFSSGPEGPYRGVRSIWRVLYRAGVDVVLNGHDHNYQRFGKLTPSGDRAIGGIREFVVGTGGSTNHRFVTHAPWTQERIRGRPGVLTLRMYPHGYAWRFRQIDGRTGDDGRSECHE